jgi:hypothetical protein
MVLLSIGTSPKAISGSRIVVSQSPGEEQRFPQENATPVTLKIGKISGFVRGAVIGRFEALV